MNKPKVLYRISWTQVYTAWPKPQAEQEPEIVDFTQALEVLARIMER